MVEHLEIVMEGPAGRYIADMPAANTPVVPARGYRQLDACTEFLARWLFRPLHVSQR